ncbi:P1 family peptidase [Ramlibacter rhizophilus]|uniref:Peptidase S58 family protein n=1 Tax=Ramlibacter rhizophilus TaxID=1781167 RepID=A0A4Z0C216_9BURK|nr:P1 family peptidase [Ramlibacter rhizophilus]TFZ04269.1 peptidase S58 family protein [Ramlibacter rhizophilus]
MTRAASPPHRFDTPAGAITDVPGIEVGHFTHALRPTGCSVVLARAGAVAGVDVRGAAPGTRETELLAPSNTVEQVHAIVLAGGSAFGLDAAGGVMRWLDQRGIGIPVGPVRVPIVPAAVLFDLVLGDGRIRPDAGAGYAACEAASATPPQEGCVGAGAGAAVGKLFGLGRAMKGGIGTASVRVGDVTVGALVACNALGDVIDPDTGAVLAGARSEDGRSLLDTRRSLLAGITPKPMLAGANTSIGVVATDATITKAQCHRLAQAAHDGLARAVNPVHTVSDGDTFFALSTARVDAHPGMVVLATMAAEAVARATVRAVLAATGWRGGGLELPAARELRRS